MTDPFLRAVKYLADAVVATLRGDVIGAIRHAADAALELVPIDVAQGALDDAAVRRANAIANAAEVLKYGPEKL